MIRLIDNYDSFTYNLYQYLCELGAEVEVVRNDQITLDEIREKQPEKIVISPGPCTPDKAGISNDIIATFGSKVPTLGVCLGHQCVGQTYGGTVGGAGEMEVTAWTKNGLIMGVRHKNYPVEGIQFHPESIMTHAGKDILSNFLNQEY